MRDAMSFETHIRQSGRGGRALDARAKGGEAAFREALAAPTEPLAEVYRQMPIYYLTNRLIVAGPETTVRWPRYSQVWDYELEIAIVTRRTRANIPEARGRRPHFRLHDLQRFLRPRPPTRRDGRPARPRQRQEFRRRQRARPWIVTPGRTRRPSDAQRRGAGQWRDAREGNDGEHAVHLPADARLRLAGRDDPRRRSVWLGHGRQLLRTGDRPLSRKRRRD